METTVKITWDKPEEQAWLCADNIKIALSAYCTNTKFEVEETSVQSELSKILDEWTDEKIAQMGNRIYYTNNIEGGAKWLRDQLRDKLNKK